MYFFRLALIFCKFAENLFIDMDNSKFIAIIPSRYASTRFPGKPLAMLAGKTVIQRVYEQVSKALSNVIVATDDDRIFQHVNGFGGKAVMTGTHHRSGTDRCWEAYMLNGGNEDIIINVQGDEPFIQPEQIFALQRCFDDPSTDIATLIKKFDSQGSYEELASPNSAKVVVNKQWHAIYFSRSVIPFLRGVPKEEWPSKHQYYTHLGMYAYRAYALSQIVAMPQSSLEIAESLEQLRWIENGIKVKVGLSEMSSIGIDTPEDLARAEEFIKQQQ